MYSMADHRSTNASSAPLDSLANTLGCQPYLVEVCIGNVLATLLTSLADNLDAIGG